MELLVLRHAYEDIKTTLARTINSGIVGMFIKRFYGTLMVQP